MIEILVLFTGLNGFVADRQLTPCCDDESCAVEKCVPDNRVRVNVLNGDKLSTVHIAALIVGEEFLQASTREKRWEWSFLRNFPDGEREVRYFGFALNTGERVRFGPVGEACRDSGCLKVVNGLAKENSPCPSREDRLDIHWLAGMKSIFPGKGRMHWDCQWAPHTKPDLVKAQFLLEEGQLSTRELARNGDKEYKVALWKAHPAVPGPFGQALAELVEWKHEIPSEEIPFIEFQRHQEDGRWMTVDVIHLQPNSRGQVIVEVKNVPEDSLCGNPPDNRLLDPHFHHLFSLVAGPRPFGITLRSEQVCEQNLPIDYPPACEEPEARFNDPQCPGALFETNP